MAVKLRRRSLAMKLLLLAIVVAALLFMPWWRERQLRTSCEQGHGRWDSGEQRCTLGPPPAASNANTNSNTNQAPKPQ